MASWRLVLESCTPSAGTGPNALQHGNLKSVCWGLLCHLITTDCVRLQLMDDCDRLDLVNAKCKRCKEMLQHLFHCEIGIWLRGRLKCGIGPKVGHCEVMLDSTWQQNAFQKLSQDRVFHWSLFSSLNPNS